MLHIFAAFAEFERELIRERTIAGLARAKADGVVLGRRVRLSTCKRYATCIRALQAWPIGRATGLRKARFRAYWQERGKRRTSRETLHLHSALAWRKWY